MDYIYTNVPEVLKGLHLRIQMIFTARGYKITPDKIAYPSKMHLLPDVTEYFRNRYSISEIEHNNDDDDDDDDDDCDEDEFKITVDELLLFA